MPAYQFTISCQFEIPKTNRIGVLKKPIETSATIIFTTLFTAGLIRNAYMDFTRHQKFEHFQQQESFPRAHTKTPTNSSLRSYDHRQKDGRHTHELPLH